MMKKYKLDYNKPSNLSDKDIDWIFCKLQEFGYDTSRKEIIKLSKQKRTVFLRDATTNNIRGYAELKLGNQRLSKTLTINWLFAPKRGKIMLEQIFKYVETELPKVDCIKLIVELDKKEDKTEIMTKARLNLYYSQGFKIDDVTIDSDLTVFSMSKLVKKNIKAV